MHFEGAFRNSGHTINPAIQSIPYPKIPARLLPAGQDAPPLNRVVRGGYKDPLARPDCTPKPSIAASIPPSADNCA